MGKSKNSRRRKNRLRRENASNLPPSITITGNNNISPSKQGGGDLVRSLSHAKTSEREVACLAIIRAFEVGTNDAAVERLRRYQTQNVLLTLFERLNDEQGAIQNLAAGAIRNITSFDDIRIIDILMQCNILQVINNLVMQIPHLLPGMLQVYQQRKQQRENANATTNTIHNNNNNNNTQNKKATKNSNDKYKFHEELLSILLNMCEISQNVNEQVSRSTNIPVVLFQLLILPIFYDEQNNLKALDEFPILYPHIDLNVCEKAASLLHTLTEENASLNEDMRKAKGGAHIKALIRVIDYVGNSANNTMLTNRLGNNNQIYLIHWHMLGVLSHLCKTFDDYVGVIDRGIILLKNSIVQLVGNNENGIGVQIQQLLNQLEQKKNSTSSSSTDSNTNEISATMEVNENDDESSKSLIHDVDVVNFFNQLNAINLGLEILGNVFQTTNTSSGNNNSVNNPISEKIFTAFDLALGLSKLGCMNLFSSWDVHGNGLLNNDKDFKEHLILQCIDLNIHATNYFDSFLYHFDPTNHVVKQNNVIHRFETLWFDFATAACRNIILLDKLSQSDVVKSGIVELNTQLMKVSEHICLCFLESNMAIKLDTPKRLDMVVRVILANNISGEARSAGIRILSFHAMFTPSIISSHFGAVCKQLLQPGMEQKKTEFGIPVIVLIDLLDVIFDIFGEDDMDPIFRSLGLLNLLQGLSQRGILFKRCEDEILNVNAVGGDTGNEAIALKQHVKDTLTNLTGFIDYKTG